MHVAVGVVKKDKSLFICKRKSNQHQGGLWEFPGGKVEQGESVYDALKRELLEEIGITIHNSSPLMLIEHDYGDKCVKLDVHIVSNFSGQAYGAEDQINQWVTINELDNYNFPDANVAIIEKIKAKYADV